MKSSILKSALVAVVGLALCAPVALQAKAKSSDSSSATAASKKTACRGTVKSVDTAANTITVTSKTGDTTFAVTADTKIKNGKTAATLADITMGEKVSVAFTADASGGKTATAITGHAAK